MQPALRKWRENRGWTLADASGLTGYSRSYLSRVERGQREPPPAAKVHMARSLGATVADLFPTVADEVPAA
jgi:transcriptional regulator with XRE-family HTH domain